MSVSDEYMDFVLEQLSGLDGVISKKMFGGVGLYKDGFMFGLISPDDVLYLKVDETNKADYQNQGMKPFKPWEDKPMTMPYYEVPVNVLEDSEKLSEWALKAFDAAVDAKAKKGNNYSFLK